MKKYIIILLLFLPAVGSAQWVKFGVDSARMGDVLLKEWSGDTLRMNVDTLSLSLQIFRLADSLDKLQGGGIRYVKDAAAAYSKAANWRDDGDSVWHELRYVVDDHFVMQGFGSFQNITTDTLTKITMLYGGIVPTSHRLEGFTITTTAGNADPINSSFAAALPPIVGADSSFFAVKVTGVSGVYHLSINKYDCSANAINNLSPTGGTNYIYEPLSSTIFPPVNTGTQIVIQLWWSRRRF